MAYTGPKRRVRDARLAGVDFPGMEIEDRRMPLSIHPRDRPAREAIGQKPHEAAAACGQRPPGEARGRHRPFDQGASLDRPPGVARALRPAIMIVRSEEHTSELQSLMRSSYAVF